MTWIGVSIETQPNTCGPITIPSTISSTIAGKRILGKSPSASGAASAAAATIASPPKEIVRIGRTGELPESWIPPAHILELRARVRMRKTLIDQRTAWLQRLQAQLFQQGVPAGLRLRSEVGRQALAAADLSPAGRELVELGLRMIDTLDQELAPLTRELGVVRGFLCIRLVRPAGS